MKNTIAMVFAGGRVEELSTLTERRAKAAVIMGGAYRTIDFALTSLADSGIGRVGILAQYRPFSLMDHVGNGIPWDLVGTERQVRFLPPYLRLDRREWYRGPADALYQNLEFIQRYDGADVLLVSGDHAYHTNYEALLNSHREHGADLTMAFAPMDNDPSRFGIGELNAAGQIVNFTEKPAHPRTNLASMSVCLFRRQVLIDELQQAASGSGEESTFQIHEILRRMIPRRRAYGWIYHGAWHYTRTLDEYYEFHRELLGPQPAIDLADWHLRTNIMGRHSTPPPPARHLPGSQLENSLVSGGCVIAGTVRNSVLSPGVRVEAGATVVDSVLWDDVVVEAGAHLDRVISDKRVRFGGNARVGEGETVPSEEMPQSLTCGATVIGMDVQVPAGARIGRNCIIHIGASEQDLQSPVPSGKSLRSATPPFQGEP